MNTNEAANMLYILKALTSIKYIVYPISWSFFLIYLFLSDVNVEKKLT